MMCDITAISGLLFSHTQEINGFIKGFFLLPLKEQPGRVMTLFDSTKLKLLLLCCSQMTWMVRST